MAVLSVNKIKQIKNNADMQENEEMMGNILADRKASDYLDTTFDT